MALTTDRKKEIIEGFKVHENDTGSPEVRLLSSQKGSDPH